MYTDQQIANMNQEQLKAAILQLQGGAVQVASATEQKPVTMSDVKKVIAETVANVIVAQQPKAVSFTESFLEKHQISPQVAGVIAVSAIGSVVEIIKALLQILVK